MSTRKDRLVARDGDPRDRLNYAQGVLLDSHDFEDEQLYHRGRLARGLQYLFGSGTVAGLGLAYDADHDELEVKPGLALDPLGRLIEVPGRWCLGLGGWLAAQLHRDLADSWVWVDDNPVNSSVHIFADVFVRFAVCERAKTPAFASGPYDALDAVVPARLRDGFELALILRPEARARRQDILAAAPEPTEIPTPTATARALALLGLTPSDRLDAMHDDILTAWREGTDAWTNDRPPRLPEHLAASSTVNDPLAVGRDPTSVMLGRVKLPASVTGEPDAVPERTPGEPDIDPYLRRFVYGPGILTRVAESGGG